MKRPLVILRLGLDPGSVGYLAPDVGLDLLERDGLVRRVMVPGLVNPLGPSVGVRLFPGNEDLEVVRTVVLESAVGDLELGVLDVFGHVHPGVEVHTPLGESLPLGFVLPENPVVLFGIVIDVQLVADRDDDGLFPVVDLQMPRDVDLRGSMLG